MTTETTQKNNNDITKSGSLEKYLTNKIDTVRYLLLCFFMSLYFMPYFTVVFHAPRWMAIREILFVILLMPLIHKWYVLKTPLWMYLYILILLQSLIISQHLSIAFITFRTLIQFVSVYFFCKAYIKNKNQLIFFCKFFYSIGLIAVIIVVIQGIVGPIPMLNMYQSLDEGSMRFGVPRLSTIFGNTITTGILELMFLVQVLIVNKQSIIKYILVICTCLGIMLTVSKAAILMMLLVLVYYFSMKILFKIKLLYKIALLSVLVFLLVILADLIFTAHDQLNSDTLYIMDNVTIEDQLESDFESRFLIKPQMGISMMLDISPLTFFFGAGFDIAGQAAASQAEGIRPHNAVFEIFMTMGLLGVILYGYIFTLLLKVAINIKPITSLNMHLKGLASGLVVALLASLGSDPHVTQIFMIPTFFMLAINNKKFFCKLSNMTVGTKLKRCTTTNSGQVVV